MLSDSMPCSGWSVLDGVNPSHPAKFGSHKHCGIEDINLVVEGQDSISSHLNPALMFTSKLHGMKVHGMPYHMHLW